VRVSRNCPWNRCAFCPVYKGQRFSLRSVEEVLSDLEAMRQAFGARHRTVFLQDANPLVSRPDDLIRIVEGIRERFPEVGRITAYARAHTLVRRSLAELRRIRAAGLDRLHVGLESGCDEVLKLVSKGITRTEQIEAGRRAKEADFELSEYVMPGLGGRRLSDAHADDTASALDAIQPDFIRLRTTTVSPGTELADMQRQGAFEPLGEAEVVREIRRLISGLGNVHSHIESDHAMNLLMEVRGSLPGDQQHLLDQCDTFLCLPPRRQQMFILGRRLGWLSAVAELDAVEGRLDSLLARLEANGSEPELAFAELRARVL
jgi:coproporphyrinogen III oxidase-like Fe-S oxidoreductase